MKTREQAGFIVPRCKYYGMFKPLYHGRRKRHPRFLLSDKRIKSTRKPGCLFVARRQVALMFRGHKKPLVTVLEF